MQHVMEFPHCSLSSPLLLLLLSPALALFLTISTSSSPLIVSLQVRLFYDKLGHQLIVTVLGAKDLPVGEDLRPRNPYVKIYFLPDRR